MERPVFPHFTSNKMFYYQNRSDFLSRVRSSYFGFCYLLLSFKALVSDDTVTHTHDVFEIYQSNAIHVQVWQFYKTLTKIVIINVSLSSFFNTKWEQKMSTMNELKLVCSMAGNTGWYVPYFDKMPLLFGNSFYMSPYTDTIRIL